MDAMCIVVAAFICSNRDSRFRHLDMINMITIMRRWSSSISHHIQNQNWLCFPKPDLSHGSRVVPFKKILFRLFRQNLIHLGEIKINFTIMISRIMSRHHPPHVNNHLHHNYLMSPLDDNSLNIILHCTVHLPTITLSHLGYPIHITTQVLIKKKKWNIETKM